MRGIFPVLQTALDENNELDFISLKKQVVFPARFQFSPRQWCFSPRQTAPKGEQPGFPTSKPRASHFQGS